MLFMLVRIILRQKARPFFVSGTEVINTTAFLAPKYLLSHNIPLTRKKAQHKYHTIVVIKLHRKGVSHCPKVGTGRKMRAQKTHINNLQHDSYFLSNGSVFIETTSLSPRHVGCAHVNEKKYHSHNTNQCYSVDVSHNPFW